MLIVHDQYPTEALDPNFKPDYVVGDAGVYDPVTGVTYSAYGLTDWEYQQRIDGVQRLWGKRSGVGDVESARKAQGSGV